MDWFLIWNVTGLGIAAWHMGKQFLGNKEPSFADTLFGICMIPVWPLLLWIIVRNEY